MHEIARIDQREALRGKRSFVLRDDGTLAVDYKSLGAEKSHTVQIAALDPNPRREQHSEVGLLVVFILLSLGLLSSALGVISSQDEGTRVGCIVAGIPLLILVIVSGVSFRRRSFDFVIFDNLLTNDVLLMYNQKPTKEEFRSFIGKLQEQIQEHRGTFLSASDGGIADQLRSLAKLRDEGILSEEEFAIAKVRVIGGNDHRGPIGFSQ